MNQFECGIALTQQMQQARLIQEAQVAQVFAEIVLRRRVRFLQELFVHIDEPRVWQTYFELDLIRIVRFVDHFGKYLGRHVILAIQEPHIVQIVLGSI